MIWSFRSGLLYFIPPKNKSVLQNLVAVGCVCKPKEKCFLTLFLSTAVDFALADTELTRSHRMLYWHAINLCVCVRIGILNQHDWTLPRREGSIFWIKERRLRTSLAYKNPARVCNYNYTRNKRSIQWAITQYTCRSWKSPALTRAHARITQGTQCLIFNTHNIHTMKTCFITHSHTCVNAHVCSMRPSAVIKLCFVCSFPIP